MTISVIEGTFSICKLQKPPMEIGTFCFLEKTDQELSYVCPTKDTPKDALVHDDGWSMFRVQGPLDFSLIGILSAISAALAAEHIGIFAISTYDTDYILTKQENFPKALACLEKQGWTIA